MKKRLIANVEFEPDAVMGLTNTSGMGIKISNDGDSVEYAYHDGESWTEPETAEIQYRINEDLDDTEDAPCFEDSNGQVYWLSDFIRTDYPN